MKFVANIILDFLHKDIMAWASFTLFPRGFSQNIYLIPLNLVNFLTRSKCVFVGEQILINSGLILSRHSSKFVENKTFSLNFFFK